MENNIELSNVDFNIGLFKKKALFQLKGKWKILTIATAINLVIVAVIYLPFLFMDFTSIYNNIENLSALSNNQSSSILNNPYIFLVVSIIILVINSTLSFSRLLMHFSIFKTQNDVSFSDFIKNCSLWKKAFATEIIRTIWLNLWSLLLIFPISALSSIMLTFLPNNISAENSKIATICIFAFCYFILAIFLLIKKYQYSQIFNIVADNQNINPNKALKLSIKITRNNLKKLFILDLSFLHLFILSVISLGIGFIWYIPYKTQTKINFYDYLKRIYVESVKKEDNLQENA